MKGRFCAATTLAFVLLLTALISAAARAERINLNDGWRFNRGDAPGAENPTFPDAGWRQISVPHDWSIEDLAGQNHPFSKDGPGKAAEGYTVGGVGWYRRTFSLPADVGSKTALLRFESIYMDAEVWVNGEKLIRHRYGYTAFDLDISKVAKPGDNVVAVKVNHTQPSSRWYSGSGIIRPVHLEILDRVHVDPVGPTVTTPTVSQASATVRARTAVMNARSEPVQANLISIVLDAQGREVHRTETARTLNPASQESFDQSVALLRPKLWSLETPNLYTLLQEVRVGGTLVDSRRTRFGVRSISFDSKRGFLLNGKKVLLKGGAIHHDNYMIGAAGIPRADKRKIEIHKAAGYNAIRSAHNPISQASMDAADEIGMLIIDEAFDAWIRPKRENDYGKFFKDNWQGDITSMVSFARNHPSVIMWSIGNEIPGMGDPAVDKTAKDLADLVRSLDPTRPVTAGINLILSRSNEKDFMGALDVIGYNYAATRYEADHKAFPDRVMYGSESWGPRIGHFWDPAEKMPWVLGDFVWTSFDYMGEAGLGWIPGGPFPWHLAMSGEIDVTGKMRPAAYYRSVYWKSGKFPTSAFIAWDKPEGSLPNGMDRTNKYQYYVQEDLVSSWPERTGLPAKVVVFSEDDEVELFANGQSQGRKPVSRVNDYRTTFWALLPPGEAKVVGYKKGKKNSEWVMHSSGTPAKIRLTVDRLTISADGDDLAYVTAELLDAKDAPVALRNLDKPLMFKVSGAGTLAGVGNGDPVSLESFTSGARSTYWGRAVAVVRAGKSAGPITIEVSGDKLESATAQVVSR